MKTTIKTAIDPVCNMVVKTEDSLTLKLKDTDYYFCSDGCKQKFERKRSDTPNDSNEEFDLIIIGGGPAGLTAGVYASILKLKAFLITKDLGGQAIDSTKIENYMGFDFITGPELIQKFHYQLVNSHYIDHLIGEADLIEKDDSGGFVVTASNGKKFKSKTVLVAPGMKRRTLNIPGESKFQRKGIFYGSIQDLSYLQNKNVAVVGGGNSALQLVEDLRSISKNIFLVSDTILTGDAVIIERVRKLKNVEIFEEHKINELYGGNFLTGLQIRKLGTGATKTLAVSGAQIAIGLRPNSSLVTKLVELNKKDEIIINYDCSTSCRGLFAAGDATSVYGKRIIIASGEGAKAVLAIKRFIIDSNKLKKI
ncbi:MAG: FAD-dependent oxidoreductase [Bacteroidales bacterium]|nr:FAD-dependent oxidoreductase [Bacteroidales bacterium]